MDRSQTEKRRYRNSLQFVESGFRACWHNALDQVNASKLLLDCKLHAPALATAVLALEEIAKLMAIDGLLFARADDYKAEMFQRADRSHSAKLGILWAMPIFIGNLCGVDPRYDTSAYGQAMAITLNNLKRDGNTVLPLLRDDGFMGLDRAKQQSLYVSVTGSGFVAPREAIAASLAEKVHMLAWRAATTLDFALKDGNLERYMEHARAVRGKLTEAQHLAFERLGKHGLARLFGADEAGPDDSDE